MEVTFEAGAEVVAAITITWHTCSRQIQTNFSVEVELGADIVAGAEACGASLVSLNSIPLNLKKASLFLAYIIAKVYMT